MTATEIKFLLWGVGILLGVLGFIGALAVKQLMKMAQDLNEIKTIIKVVETKHDALEQRVDKLETITQ